MFLPDSTICIVYSVRVLKKITRFTCDRELFRCREESFMKLINIRCRFICSVSRYYNTIPSCARSRVYYIRLLFYVIMSVDRHLCLHRRDITLLFYAKTLRTIFSIWRFHETFLFQTASISSGFLFCRHQSVGRTESIVYGIRLRHLRSYAIAPSTSQKWNLEWEFVSVFRSIKRTSSVVFVRDLLHLVFAENRMGFSKPAKMNIQQHFWFYSAFIRL